mgnify:CR=1 FL=1
MYKISNLEFKTKKDIELYCRQLKKKYIDKDNLIEKDFDFICDLKTWHHNEEIRILEPDNIIIDLPEDREIKKHRCFMLLKNNHRYVFSVKKCIYNISVKKANIKIALRDAINFQILEFRHKNNIPREYHIDHIIHFEKLIEDWLEELNLELTDLVVVEEGSYKKLNDKNIEHSWIQYHKHNAKLRKLLVKDNLKRKKYKPEII